MQDTLPQFRKAANWIALFGPAALPPAVVGRISTELNRALNAPEVRSAIEQTTTMIIGGSPAELAATMKSDLEITAQLVKALGLQPE